MRMAPIGSPKGLLPRMANWLARRRLGKVPAPMRIVYPRMPALYRLTYAIVQIEEKKLTVDPALRILVTTHVAMLNGCSFCLDIGRALAVQAKVTLERLDALPEWRESDAFSAAERAALDYAEEVTRHVHVKDAVYEELRRHYDEREIVEITWLVAIEGYYNRLAGPLGLESDGLCEIALRRSA